MAASKCKSNSAAAAETRTDLKRVKRQMESGQMAAASSVRVLAQDSGSQAAPQLSSSSGSSPGLGPPSPASTVTPFAGTKLWKVLVSVAVILVAAAIGEAYHRLHQVKRLTDKDTIVLSDFDNKTGESVFDDALKQGLADQD